MNKKIVILLLMVSAGVAGHCASAPLKEPPAKLEKAESLTAAGRKGSLEQVEGMLDEGADVNTADRFGTTVLMRAAEGGHLDVVQLLVKRGADVNRKDEWDTTALSRARDRGNDQVVAYLLENGAR